MIYFLTEWQSKSTDLESNMVFNINKVFYEGQIDSKIINTLSSPFLNYLTNPFEFYNPSHFIDLLDAVKEPDSLNYVPLTLRDMTFPKDWEKIYTRTNILLTKDGDIKAEVFLNAFGFVSQVYYYTGLGKEIDVYTEKGTIMCKQYIDAFEEQVEQQFFDEKGQLILTQRDDWVFISEPYKRKFKHAVYQTFSEVCIEMLNGLLENFNPKEDKLVVEGTNAWLMHLIEGFKFPKALVYLFNGPAQEGISQLSSHLSLVKQGGKLVSDNPLFQEELKVRRIFRSLQNKFHLIPFYPTNLTLGESNRYLEQFVYWQVDRIDAQVKALLNKFLEVKLELREFCLIIEGRDEREFIDVINSFIVQHFEISFTSSEYQLVQRYYEALENSELTPDLRERFQSAKQECPGFDRFIESYLFYRGISFRKKFSTQGLKEDFQKVRLYIDHRKNSEFLSHSLAVSAGIPVLSKNSSPYLIDGKNGYVYEDERQLLEVVKTYLTDPDQWNKNLVESVEIIETNNTSGLLEKWKECLE